MATFKRAAVLIGVQQAHTLPKLEAVWDGVHRMEEWARSQGFERERVATITDESEKVTPNRIKTAIKQLLKPNDLDQLIVYFSGHGINLKYGEYWLLSDAIEDSDAAVNVKGSEERARYGPVPHVIFVSDSCRTAAQGIQAQGVEGSIIFPNKPVPGPEKSVDLFYATLLGEPALEIDDPNDAADSWQAVYTDALLEALHGKHPDILETTDTDQRYLRPRPLKKFLATDLPVRVYQATRGPNPRSQQPDARITSDDNAWIAAVNLPVSRSAPDPPRFGLPQTPGAAAHGEFTMRELDQPAEIMMAAISRDDANINDLLIRDIRSGPTDRIELDVFSEQNRNFEERVRSIAEPFGPLHYETGCGFKLRGAEAAECIANHATFEVLDDPFLVRASIDSRPAVSALLTLTNGNSVLIPAIQDFLATLVFDGDNLVNVVYEPSEYSDRYQQFEDRATELRELRAVIASSSRLGIFRLDGPEADTLARRMQVAKGIDPALALYAAHAFRDQGNRDRIIDMARYMDDDIGICLFDIALLAGRLDDNIHAAYRERIFPFLPMLSQSWALLPAYEVALPNRLKHISRHVLPNSLWTVFDHEGTQLISNVIRQGIVL